MPHTKEQANAEIEAALPMLTGFDMPSTRHMSQDEREGAIGQMLADLWMLAHNDGCIAAAWAYEFCTHLAKSTVVTNIWVTDTGGAKHFSSGVLSPAEVEKIGLPPEGLSRIPVRVIREPAHV